MLCECPSVILAVCLCIDHRRSVCAVGRCQYNAGGVSPRRPRCRYAKFIAEFVGKVACLAFASKAAFIRTPQRLLRACALMPCFVLFFFLFIDGSLGFFDPWAMQGAVFVFAGFEGLYVSAAYALIASDAYPLAIRTKASGILNVSLMCGILFGLALSAAVRSTVMVGEMSM